MHQSPFVLLDDGLQLEDVAHQQQLLAAEGLSHVAAIDAQHAVDKVNNICAYHRYFVDDNQF